MMLGSEELTRIFGVKAIMKAFTCCFVLLVSCGALLASDSVGTFSALPHGEEMQVGFQSVGCFHSLTYELSFRRASEAIVSVAKVEYGWSQERHVITATNRVELGELTLSEAELAGLDRLLRYYRASHTGGCTTRDVIVFSRRRDGRIVATEQFTDDSCATYDMKDLVTIPALVQRLEKRK
jgi:hypothetical protein